MSVKFRLINPNRIDYIEVCDRYVIYKECSILYK